MEICERELSPRKAQGEIEWKLYRQIPEPSAPVLEKVQQIPVSTSRSPSRRGLFLSAPFYKVQPFKHIVKLLKILKPSPSTARERSITV